MPLAEPSNLTPLRAQQLRDLLRQKYPDAHRLPTPGGSALLSASCLTSTDSDRNSFSPDDALTLNALEGQFTEITGGASPEACPGIALILHHVLEQAATAGRGAVLVDGADCFDPQSYPAELSRNLFWARCHEAVSESGRHSPLPQTALQVTDLFLRDGNLPLVILDLFSIPERELARIPLSVWYRLRQLTEQTGCGLCLLTSRSTGPAAHRRFALTAALTLDALDLPRSTLLPQLRLRLERSQSRQLKQPLAFPPSLLASRRIA